MMMCSVLLCILLLSVCLCVGSWQLSASSSAKSALWTLAGKRAQLSSSRLYDSQYDKPTDREETREEMIERLRKKARKMMYNEKGVPFAPWMSKQIDEDVSRNLVPYRTLLHACLCNCIEKDFFLSISFSLIVITFQNVASNPNHV